MVCPWWLCFSFDNPLRRLFHDPERLLDSFVKPGMTCIDIGCGMGYFTIGLAKKVGPGGKIIAIDIQKRMLAVLERRAQRAALSDRIVPHRCSKESLGLQASADFALAFWMVHEVPDLARFFREVFVLLNPGSHFLLVEPKYHVPRKTFERICVSCREAGFEPQAEPVIALSRAVLMKKG
jgi:ubiquinone/menaquinone biosynthesis C-methylase UbiE